MKLWRIRTKPETSCDTDTMCEWYRSKL